VALIEQNPPSSPTLHPDLTPPQDSTRMTAASSDSTKVSLKYLTVLSSFLLTYKSFSRSTVSLPFPTSYSSIYSISLTRHSSISDCLSSLYRRVSVRSSKMPSTAKSTSVMMSWPSECFYSRELSLGVSNSAKSLSDSNYEIGTRKTTASSPLKPLLVFDNFSASSPISVISPTALHYPMYPSSQLFTPACAILPTSPSRRRRISKANSSTLTNSSG